MRRSRPNDHNQQLERLEQKHVRLKARVRELDGQLFLTANEERERMRLKKEKLATKDQLEGLRQQMA